MTFLKTSLVPALFLSGCVSLLPEAAPADIVYRLSAAKPYVPQSPDAFVVRIDRPSVSNEFETRDIIVSPDGRRLASAGGARWAELIPVMIQNSLVDLMGQHEKLVGVIPSSGARTDTRIHLTVKGFEAQFDQGEDAAPLAVVHYAVVKAMDTANQQALEDIVIWLERPRTRS